MKKGANVEIANPFTLRSIYLRSSNQWMAMDFEPAISGQPLIGRFKLSQQSFSQHESKTDTPDSEIVRSSRFTTKFEFRYLKFTEDTEKKLQDNEHALDDDDSSDLVAKIFAEISVDYLNNSSEIIPESDMKKWGTGNVLLHCWPYWREFCHSTLLRMNLPVLIIPLVNPALIQHGPSLKNK